MGDIPRARFLPQKPLLILPRQSSRERRENVAPRPSALRRWGNALVPVLVVIGFVLIVAIGFFCAIKSGEFVHLPR